jgi:hypothetical protein
MELIERYVNEVGRRLPKGKRDDICKELRSALDDALEGRSFGKPSESDIVAVLNEFGSPQAVAASYSGDHYLIGPEIYPQFVFTLKLVAAVLAGLVVLSSGITVFSSASGLEALTTAMAGTVNSIIDSFITALGIVVIVFFLLERLDLKIDFKNKEKTWSPMDLPAVRDVDIVGRFDSIAAVVFPAIVLVLMNQFKDRVGIRVSTDSDHFSVGISSDSGGVLLLNDVFLDNLTWLNLSLILPMALSVWLFWSGRWHLPTRLLKIAFDVFGLYVFYRICQGIIAVESDLLAAGIPPKLVEHGIRGLELAPLLVAIAVVIGAVSHLFKAYKSFGRATSAPTFVL